MNKWLMVFACSGLVNCGGGGGGGSGVDGSQSVAELDEAEASELCEYLLTREEPRTVVCGDTTISFGTTAEELEEQLADCTQELSSVPAACGATVNDLESCSEASANQIEGLSDQEICDIVNGDVDPPASPSACEALDDPDCEDDGGRV